MGDAGAGPALRSSAYTSPLMPFGILYLLPDAMQASRVLGAALVAYLMAWVGANLLGLAVVMQRHLRRLRAGRLPPRAERRPGP